MTENENPKQGKTVYKCTNCNEAEFETAAQLRGHQMTCRPNTESSETPKDEPKREQKRVPFGAPRQRIPHMPDSDKYHYRMFNDRWRREPGRIKRALAAGYEVVEHPESGMTVGTNEDGSEIKGILMRIPKELWEQDQALKEEGRKETDNQIYRGRHMARPGDGRYTPSEGIRMESKLNP